VFSSRSLDDRQRFMDLNGLRWRCITERSVLSRVSPSFRKLCLGTRGSALIPDVTERIRAITAGDDEAFREFHHIYQPKLVGWAWHFRLSSDDLADHLQDFWIHLLRRRIGRECVLATYSLRDGASFDSWLKVVWRNFLLERIAREARRMRPMVHFEEFEAWDIEDCNAAVDATLLITLQTLMRRLAPRERRVVALKTLGFGNEEIAERCGMSVNHLGVTLKRARDKLKRLLLIAR